MPDFPGQSCAEAGTQSLAEFAALDSAGMNGDWFNGDEN
jgi:hypothetical protein